MNKTFVALIATTMLLSGATAFADEGERESSRDKSDQQRIVKMTTHESEDGQKSYSYKKRCFTTTASARTTSREREERETRRSVRSVCPPIVVATTTPAVPAIPPVVPPTVPPAATSTSAVLTISNLAVSAIGTSSATVTWNTNTAASAKIFYSVTAPVTTSGVANWSDANLLLAHGVQLKGLTANTTYYYIVTDANGSTTATSNQGTFKTLAVVVTPPAAPTFTLAQIASHNTAANCYSAVSGGVYDLTTYISSHPGGSVIASICGKDGTALFTAQHGGQSTPVSVLASYKIGTLI